MRSLGDRTMFRKSMDVVLIVSLFSVIVQSAGIPINRFLGLNPVVCRYTLVWRIEILEMSNGSYYSITRYLVPGILGRSTNPVVWFRL